MGELGRFRRSFFNTVVLRWGIVGEKNEVSKFSMVSQVNLVRPIMEHHSRGGKEGSMSRRICVLECKKEIDVGKKIKNSTDDDPMTSSSDEGQSVYSQYPSPG